MKFSLRLFSSGFSPRSACILNPLQHYFNVDAPSRSYSSTSNTDFLRFICHSHLHTEWKKKERMTQEADVKCSPCDWLNVREWMLWDAAFMRQASFTGGAHDLFTDSDILSSLVPIIYSWQLYLIWQRDADDNGRRHTARRRRRRTMHGMTTIHCMTMMMMGTVWRRDGRKDRTTEWPSERASEGVSE